MSTRWRLVPRVKGTCDDLPLLQHLRPFILAELNVVKLVLTKDESNVEVCPTCFRGSRAALISLPQCKVEPDNARFGKKFRKEAGAIGQALASKHSRGA
jgi:hypothetical protein